MTKEYREHYAPKGCFNDEKWQKSYKRTYAPKGCFNDEKWKTFALSMHFIDAHKMNFNLDNFEIKKVPPQQIGREEVRYIDKYRTNSLGFTRYNVVR